MDLHEQQLENLEARMSELVNRRRERIERAEKEIKDANRWFDTQAVPLGRKIGKLRAMLEPVSEPTPIAVKHGRKAKPLPAPDPDWTPEEVEHYRELVANR